MKKSCGKKTKYKAEGFTGLNVDIETSIAIKNLSHFTGLPIWCVIKSIMTNMGVVDDGCDANILHSWNKTNLNNYRKFLQSMNNK